MVLMSAESHEVIVNTAIEQSEKIRQLTELIKARPVGDSHLQEDLLK